MPARAREPGRTPAHHAPSRPLPGPRHAADPAAPGLPVDTGDRASASSGRPPGSFHGPVGAVGFEALLPAANLEAEPTSAAPERTSGVGGPSARSAAPRHRYASVPTAAAGRTVRQARRTGAVRALRAVGTLRPGPPWAPPARPGGTPMVPAHRHRARRIRRIAPPRTQQSTPAVPLALVALSSVGYLPAYLLPAIVVRVVGDLGVTSTQAGAVGSGLLLASASAGLVLATRVRAIGSLRLARAGLALLVLGFALAAVAPALVPLVLGCLLGGLGAGTVAAVAGVEAAALAQPHRVPAFGLLAASGTAAALFLALPRLGGGHALPFAALAAYGAAAWSTLRRLSHRTPATTRAAGPASVLPVARLHPDAVTATRARPGLPHRAGGAVLAVGTALWSMAQNALWGVSGQIGLHRVGLAESSLGLVFAGALGGGLLGVVAAAALGTRTGRALPIGLGTATIAACVATAGSAHSAGPFAVGEVLWNTVYPIALTHLLGLAATLDRHGRWAVLVGAASALGVACGPLTGATLVTTVGFPGTGLALGALLAALAVPLAATARRCGTPGTGVATPRTV